MKICRIFLLVHSEESRPLFHFSAPLVSLRGTGVPTGEVPIVYSLRRDLREFAIGPGNVWSKQRDSCDLWAREILTLKRGRDLRETPT